MNVNIRAKDSFVHNNISMHKREEREVPEAQAKALIDGGLAEKVTQRAASAPARASAIKRAPTPGNKMAQGGSNKAATGSQGTLSSSDEGAGSASGETGTGDGADTSAGQAGSTGGADDAAATDSAPPPAGA